MAFIRKHTRTISIAAVCAAIAAAVGVITSAGAATTTTTSGQTPMQGHARRGLLHRFVHGDLIVRTRSGFVTVSVDRGFVQSVSGQQLTLKEGTKTNAYKTVTLTIPSSARVRVDRHPATLSAVKSGQRAIVVQAPQRTLVIARTPGAA
jgi:hypothetical protein